MNLTQTLESAGMPPADVPGRLALLESAISDFTLMTGARPVWAWWVPGRIEVFGKHTDYAGGRSLVAAVPRGFAVVAAPRSDSIVRARDAVWHAEVELAADDQTTPFKGWTNYIAVVVRRLASNFPGAALGADITFAGDLPRAAGVSSSSALVVGIALALIERASLRAREDWRAVLSNNLELAGYLGAVENGLTFGALAGTLGVGTHGGSEDHTAILNCRPGCVSAFSYVPVHPIGVATLPPDWTFVVMSSGIEASKAGAARSRYNRASLATKAIADVWRLHTGYPGMTLAAALSDGQRPRVEEAIDAVPHPDFTRDELLRRLQHFVAEDGRVPVALEAVAGSDQQTIADLASATQRDAEQLLGNQIPETSMLAALACEEGAFAASSFGAGFGGSVWALVQIDAAEAFIERWKTRYLDRCSPEKPVAAFIARPAPAATVLSLT